MEDEIFKLLEELHLITNNLNVDDVEGHVWYGRFMDMVKKYATKCPACDEGYILDEDYEQGCCGTPLPTGECCGNAIAFPIQIQKQCSYCGAVGYVPKNHLNL